MLITIKSGHSQVEVYDAIEFAFHHSRFTLEPEMVGKTRLKLRNIRLKESKRYCGNHPNACDIEGGRMGNYLEGVDWVEFNDRLNDVFDMLSASAFIRSERIVIVRKHFKRRIAYTSHPFAFNPNVYEWDYDGTSPGDFEDYCGRIAPASIYPPGTPGSYERMVAWVGSNGLA